MAEVDWRRAREQMMLDPSVINLNTGSFGPLSKPVFERVTELRRALAEEPMNFLVRETPRLLSEARSRLADFLGCDATRLVFTANVTAAMNMVASALRLTSPGEILLTDHEYGAMQWCWERVAQRQGLTLRTFPLPTLPSGPEEIVEQACRAMTSKTRLLFFSHVLSPTGMILPAKRLCEEAKKRGILTVIDGAHAPAYVPLQLSDVPCDFYGANCHKWLLAPTGAGFLYIGEGNEDCLQPLQVSWGWKQSQRSDFPDEFGSTSRIRFLEFEGTRDPCAWLSIPTAIDFQASLGWEQIRQRIRSLTQIVRNRLSNLDCLALATPGQEELSGAMTAFQMKTTLSANQLRQFFWEHRIEIPVIERPKCILIRLSTHFYNHEEEIERAVEMLTSL